MCVCVCVCVKERDLENVCVDARASVLCVCEKRERVWVYVCVVVWECVDLAFVPSSILSFTPELLLHSPKSEDLATSRLHLTLAL